MNRRKAEVLDHFVSPRALAGPLASPASQQARAALRDDPAYGELRRRLAAIGFFAPARGDYAWRIAVTAAIAASGWTAAALGRSTGLQIAGAIALGVAMVQSSLLAHDAGHGALARRPWLVELLGQVHATLIAGLAFSYFRRGHDLHHYHTNEKSVDPDCLSELFSVEPHAAGTKTGIGRWITRHQGVAIPLLLPMWALAMKWDGLTYVARNHRQCRRDLAILVVHVAVWLAIPAALSGIVPALCVYLAGNAVAGAYLGAVVPINHVATRYLAPDHTLSFLEHQLATCRNVRVPGPAAVAAVLDFLFIGLNHQIEHHLFPWAPVSRLARGAAVVRSFCREIGLPYHETTYGEAIRTVLHHLWRVGRDLEHGQRIAQLAPPRLPADGSRG